MQQALFFKNYCNTGNWFGKLDTHYIRCVMVYGE